MDRQVRGLHILIVEDNIVNQKVARRLLEKNGFKVDVVDDGKEAVEALKDHSYNLVLMDIQMPEMDGIEATIAIREMEKATSNHVPIIALTANSAKGMKERCFEAGMDGFLSKPLDIPAFLEVAEQVLSN